MSRLVDPEPQVRQLLLGLFKILLINLDVLPTSNFIPRNFEIDNVVDVEQSTSALCGYMARFQ